MLDLAHSEFIDLDKLNSLPVDKVLKLPTSAWGKEGEGRDAYFQSVKRLADEASNNQDFDTAARRLMTAYRRTAEDVLLERRDLGYKLMCEVARDILAGGGIYTGVEDLLQLPITSTTAILAITSWTVEKLRRFGGAWERLRANEQSIERATGLGMSNYNRRLGPISNLP